MLTMLFQNTKISQSIILIQNYSGLKCVMHTQMQTENNLTLSKVWYARAELYSWVHNLSGEGEFWIGGRQSYLVKQLLWLPKKLWVYFYMQFFLKRVSVLQCVKIISLYPLECFDHQTVNYSHNI